ncbi:MAG: DUF4340 domain-containing protein [Planctomycetes bacterium]|nr:DUF4340 domain-containing protein [Planctomycetota bacterium]
MKVSGTLVLLAVVGGLAYALWRSEQKQADEPELEPVVSALDGRSLGTALEIDVSTDWLKQVVELRREQPGSPWFVTEPLRDLASSARVEALRSVYDPAELVPAYESAELTPDLLAQTGLAAPRARLRARWPDGTESELAIGLEGPFGHDLFVRRGDRVLRGDLALYTSLQAVLDDWREPFAFANDAGDAEQVTIDRRLVGGDREVLRLARRGTGPWRLEQPESLRLEPGRAGQFIASLLSLRAQSFLPGRPTEGLGPVSPEAGPDVRIDVSGRRGTDHVELTARGAGGLIAWSQARDVWFVVDGTHFQTVVDTPVRMLRAQGLLAFPIDDARRITLAPPGGGTELELRRAEAGPFALARPVTMPADPTATGELLQALRGLVATSFVEDGATDLARYGLGPTAARVELIGSRQYEPLRLEIGMDADADNTYARRADEANVVTILRTQADILRRDWTALVDRQVLKIDASAGIAEVRIRNAEGGERRVVGAGAGLWRDATTDAVDPRLVEQVEQLFDLTATGVRSGLDGDFGEPTQVVDLRSTAGGTLATLRFVDRPDGTLLCQSADRTGVVYELGHLVSEAVRELRP